MAGASTRWSASTRPNQRVGVSSWSEPGTGVAGVSNTVSSECGAEDAQGNLPRVIYHRVYLVYEDYRLARGRCIPRRAEMSRRFVPRDARTREGIVWSCTGRCASNGSNDARPPALSHVATPQTPVRGPPSSRFCRELSAPEGWTLEVLYCRAFLSERFFLRKCEMSAYVGLRPNV